MNRVFLLTVLLVGFAWTANAQESESTRARNEADQRLYQLALRYNDLPAARIKLIELIDRNPTNTRYGELLASLYFEANQFTSAAIAAMDVIEKNDKSTVALEIAAYSLEQLGAVDRALPYFESHYMLTGTLFSLYKAAFMQYSLNRNEEALNSVNMLIKDKKSTDEKLGFAKADNTNQEVSMKAAALNMKGMIYMNMKNKEEARAALMEAITLQPDFELAQSNMKEVQKM